MVQVITEGVCLWGSQLQAGARLPTMSYLCLKAREVGNSSPWLAVMSAHMCRLLNELQPSSKFWCR